MGGSHIFDISIAFLLMLMLCMGSIPPLYPGILEPILVTLDILTPIYYNIPPSFPPPPELEEGRYGDR